MGGPGPESSSHSGGNDDHVRGDHVTRRTTTDQEWSNMMRGSGRCQCHYHCTLLSVFITSISVSPVQGLLVDNFLDFCHWLCHSGSDLLRVIVTSLQELSLSEMDLCDYISSCPTNIYNF